jgi:hypothetical protein
MGRGGGGSLIVAGAAKFWIMPISAGCTMTVHKWPVARTALLYQGWSRGDLLFEELLSFYFII